MPKQILSQSKINSTTNFFNHIFSVRNNHSSISKNFFVIQNVQWQPDWIPYPIQFVHKKSKTLVFNGFWYHSRFNTYCVQVSATNYKSWNLSSFIRMNVLPLRNCCDYRDAWDEDDDSSVFSKRFGNSYSCGITLQDSFAELVKPFCRFHFPILLSAASCVKTSANQSRIRLVRILWNMFQCQCF